MSRIDLNAMVRATGEPSIDRHPGGAPAVINARGDLSVAQALSKSLEIARMTASYKCCQTTAVDAVVALPTTTAQVSLWNGENLATGRTYVLHSVSTAINASAFGGGLSLGLVGCLTQRTVVNPAGTLLTIRGTAGQQYRGQGVVALARTIANDGWFPLNALSDASLVIAGYDVAGGTLTWFARGLIVIPPGGMFSISVISTATAGVLTVRSGMRWQEVRL